MLPNMSMLSVGVNSPFMTLPPELLSHILTAYVNGDETVICELVTSVCNAGRCALEVWDFVLSYIRSHLNELSPQQQTDVFLASLDKKDMADIIGESGTRKKKWRGLEIPDPLPSNITSEMFIRQMCRIITACKDGYVHGGILQITRSLLKSKFQFMIPFMVQRLNLQTPSLLPEYKNNDIVFSNEYYVNCFPMKRNQKPGMFRGVLTDFVYEDGVPKYGVWSDDASGERYGVTTKQRLYFYTDDEWESDQPIVVDNGNTLIYAPVVRIGDLKRRITSQQFNDLTSRILRIYELHREYEFLGSPDYEIDSDYDDDIPVKTFAFMDNVKQMMGLIDGLQFLFMDKTEEGFNAFGREFITSFTENDNAETQTFWHRKLTDAELMLLYFILVEEIPNGV